MESLLSWRNPWGTSVMKRWYSDLAKFSVSDSTASNRAELDAGEDEDEDEEDAPTVAGAGAVVVAVVVASATLNLCLYGFSILMK